MGIRIYCLPDEREIEADTTETVLQAALRCGIPHAHACGGHARCSTCRVLILKGQEHCAPRSEAERALAERLQFGPDLRLACQTTLGGNVTLRRLVLDAEDVALTSQLRRERRGGVVGEEKQLAILFADIRGFTAFSDGLPPYDVVHVLNRYFDAVGRVIRRHAGRIGGTMGDGFMAMFGLDDREEAPLRAVRAGLELLEVVKRLAPYLQAIHGRSFQIGVGLHCGEAVVGAIGADPVRRVTAIGDAVNVASRIEQANKEVGTHFLISTETYALISHQVEVSDREIRLHLPGKHGEHRLYQVIGLQD